MSRNNATSLEYRPALAALATAITARGAAALARQRADEAAEGALLPRTVYAALAKALGQRPQAVRRELRHYVEGTRMCTPSKCLRLVGAAADLGWIPPDAKGTGAEVFVAWCRREKQSLEMEKEDKVVRAQMRRRAELSKRAHEIVSFAAKSSPSPEEAAATLAELPTIFCEALEALVGQETMLEVVRRSAAAQGAVPMAQVTVPPPGRPARHRP